MRLIGANTQRERLISTALAAAVACAVLLPLLGHKLLTEWDEGIYAEVSREMLDGSWLYPHWNGQLWMEKPPLMLWITAIFFKLFGVNEFWARAGSALSGVAIVAVLHGWLARRSDLFCAWMSTVMLLATFGFLHVCHVGEMDVLLSLGACVALIGLVQVEEDRASGWYWFWLGFAIALMTKGAASVVIPLTAVVYAVTQRWTWRRFGSSFGLGLLLFAAVVLPWHVAMYLRFGHRFVAEYVGFHVLTRAAQQIEGHRTHWWFYLEVLLVSAPPFCLLYPVSVWRGFKRPELRVWAIFALVVLVFFTVIQTRLPHYVAPVYPVLSLLTAVWVGDWLKLQRRAKADPFGMTNKGVIAAAAIWAISILATHSTLKSLHSAQLGDGSTRLDNKEADALLKSVDMDQAPAGGPLLLWRDGPVQSIATVIFYARRPVQQVELHSPAPGMPLDPYTYDPMLLKKAVGCQTQLILLDKPLVPKIPFNLIYTPLRPSATVELGTITAYNRERC